MPGESLRATILRGGAYLTVRQGLGTAIAIGGVLILTRIIGPAQYGIYAGAMGIFVVAQLISQLGINVFLIRSEHDIDATTCDTASTLLLGLGVVTAALLIAAIPLIEATTRIAGIAPIALALFASLPVSQLSLLPLSLLERKLDYKRTAAAELSAQALFMIVGIAAALRHAGAWALVLGWWAQQLTLLVLLYRAARCRPSFGWNAAVVKEAVEYGTAYTASTWLFQLRKLVNPIVVGRYLGAEAVGIVSVTAQIVTNLSFISVAAWRLSTAALARLQSDRLRVSRAINEGMVLQVFAVAPFLIGFAILGPWLVPNIMGARWTPITTLFPYIALVQLTTGPFNLHASALYVLKQNWAMSLYHVAHTMTLAMMALLLVPRFGLNGYGLAEISTIATFIVLHERAARHIPHLTYGRVSVLIAAVTPVLFYYVAGWWSIVILALGVASLRPWRDYAYVFAHFKGQPNS